MRACGSCSRAFGATQQLKAAGALAPRSQLLDPHLAAGCVCHVRLDVFLRVSRMKKRPLDGPPTFLAVGGRNATPEGGELTHVDGKGKVSMVDVGSKATTHVRPDGGTLVIHGSALVRGP